MEKEERIEEMAEAFRRALTSLVFRQVKQEWQTTRGGVYWGFTEPDPRDEGE